METVPLGKPSPIRLEGVGALIGLFFRCIHIVAYGKSLFDSHRHGNAGLYKEFVGEMRTRSFEKLSSCGRRHLQIATVLCQNSRPIAFILPQILVEAQLVTVSQHFVLGISLDVRTTRVSQQKKDNSVNQWPHKRGTKQLPVSRNLVTVKKR